MTGTLFPGHFRDERLERRELLLDEIDRGLVLELPALVELGLSHADKHFRFVERDGVEIVHHLAEIVLHARAADQFALVEPSRVIYSLGSAVMVNLVLVWNHRPDAQSLSHVKTAFVARR